MLAENPSLKKSALKKFRQKQQIKKKYQKTKRAEQTAKQAKRRHRTPSVQRQGLRLLYGGTKPFSVLFLQSCF